MKHSPDTTNKLLSALHHQLRSFHRSLDDRCVASTTLSAPSLELPDRGIDFDTLNHIIDTQVQPHLSASNGGRYWGFVTGGANPIATYADWLVSVYNQNVAKGGDSIASAIEQQTLRWLCDLFYLPDTFDGVLTTGATAANFLAAVTARQFAGHQQGLNIARDGMQGVDVQIYSATPHASMEKSLGLAGFGQRAWQHVSCNNGLESMNVVELEKAMATSQATSHIVIASAATVTGTDYDDLKAISALCQRYNAWLHVDAAFGIFERLVNGADGKTAGLELADSITLDCHKWLNVPYDCGVFLTRHTHLLQQSCDVAAPYLSGAQDDISFMSVGIENSRRFRALPVWATLLSFGRQGIREKVLKNIKQAQSLANWIDNSDTYDLIKPCELNVVLFMPNPARNPYSTEACRQQLNRTGHVFLTPGLWMGQPIIRAALSNWQTTDEDVQRVIATLQSIEQA